MTVDYPPAALYALSVVGRAYRAIDPSFTDGRGLTAAIKLAILLGDAAACFALWTLMRRYSAGAGQYAALFYWLNPATILDGAVLGYLDPWLGAAGMASLVAVDATAFAWGGAALALAIFTKPQAVLLIPVAGMLLHRRARGGELRAALTAALAASITAAALLAPFARIGALPNMRQGVGSLFRHDMLSAEAANAWWIVTWLMRASYAVHDFGAWASWTMRVRILGDSRVVALGYPNPRPIAAVLAGSVIVWAFWRARRGALPILLAAGALAAHAYFVLAIQVHENHLYLALPLGAGAAAALPRLRAPYLLVSGIFALNLFLFQGIGRDMPVPPRNVTLVDTTVLLAFVNVTALVWHMRRFSQEATHPAAVHGNGDAIHV